MMSFDFSGTFALLSRSLFSPVVVAVQPNCAGISINFFQIMAQNVYTNDHAIEMATEDG